MVCSSQKKRKVTTVQVNQNTIRRIKRLPFSSLKQYLSCSDEQLLKKLCENDVIFLEENNISRLETLFIKSLQLTF